MVVRRSAVMAWMVFLTGTLLAQPVCPPQIRWQRNFGTDNTESARRVLQTAYGGFLIGGASYGSAGNGNKTSPNYGNGDLWVVRLDADGNKLWDRSYGGSSGEEFQAMDDAGDGGFILGGNTYSGASGNKTSPFYGIFDAWVVRIDSEGNLLWEKTFGGSSVDWCNAVRRTADGGFIVGGSSASPLGGNKTAPPRGGADCWVIRLDANGNKLWENSYGGAENDYLNDIRQLPDGGFIFGGYSMSQATNEYKTAPLRGNYDFWLVRLDASGNKLWDRSYGGDDFDVLRSLVLAPNGDILLAGDSRSGVNGTKTQPNFGYENFWVIRVDAAGNEIWQGVYGGGYWGEELWDATLVSTNDFLLAGSSASLPGTNGTKTAGWLGQNDYWVVRIDGGGNPIWDATFGGTSGDIAQSAVPTADGGYVVAGYSSSVNGHNTPPHFGSTDIWVVKLNPESPLDCDNDGVPNAQDLCGDTLFGALVNTNGCSVDQICPCGGWLDHADYFACVERVSAEFESAGAITSAQRAELLAHAQTANCPPSLVLYGLTHLLLNDTLTGSYGYGYFLPGTNPVFGTTILLGEADSGIFIDPGSGGWGSYSDEWYLQGKVYGRFADGSNSLIATVRATKPYLETYPIEIDFTPLNPASLTFQYFTNGVLEHEETVAGPTGFSGANSAYYLAPRVNPFCRLADGSVGALFEFHPPEIDPGGGLYDPYPYNRVFVRADNPARQVDYVSRVDTTGHPGIEHFAFFDERLGMFHNRHRIIGSGLFQAANGQLTIRKDNQSASFELGTMIEMPDTTRVEVDFLPIDLTTYETGLRIAASTRCNTEWGCYEIGGLQIGLAGAGRLGFAANFPGLPTAALEIQVFRNGVLSGTCLADNGFGNYLALNTNQPDPKLISCVFTVSSNAPPTIAFAVDQLAALVCTNGQQIFGTHFRIVPANLASNDLSEFPVTLSAVSAVLSDPAPQPAFTITDERTDVAQPRLSIATSGNDITLSWRDNTRLFQLESSASLPGGFAAVDTDVTFTNNQNVAILLREATGSRFFRLHAAP